MRNPLRIAALATVAALAAAAPATAQYGTSSPYGGGSSYGSGGAGRSFGAPPLGSYAAPSTLGNPYGQQPRGLGDTGPRGQTLGNPRGDGSAPRDIYGTPYPRR